MSARPQTDDRGFLVLPDQYEQRLDGRDGFPPSVHVFSSTEVSALNAALATGRALLVRGEPGTGKSQLARAAAAALGRDFVYQSVDGHTDTHDLLWSLDAVARLAAAQIMGSPGHAAPRDSLAPERFIQPGALWWALDPGGAHRQAQVGGMGRCTASSCHAPDYAAGTVVLVDEIDKADPAVPNALLDALGHGGFNVHGMPRVCAAPDGPDRPGCARPLVLITTNAERSLPDAFLRRCLVLQLSLPDDRKDLEAHLLARGKVHHPDVDVAVLAKAASLLATDREKVRDRGLSPPGLAEYLDLVRAVVEQSDDVQQQRELLETVKVFTLDKHAPEPRR